MRESRVYVQLWQACGKTDRFVSSCGGTRSGKTFAALQLFRKLALLDESPCITSVVSETLPHLKRGAIRDFQAVMGDEWNDKAWNKTDCIYTFPNGSIIEFFSADSPAKVHGPARDRLFINEAQNVPFEVVRQLLVRTTGLVVFDYNPTSSFWLNDKIERQDNCVTIHSTYLDNCDKKTGEPFLTPAQIAEIESNKNDKNWWRVYGEGKVGTLDGLIFDFDQIDTLPDIEGKIETYGMDFGFSQDPTTLLHCLIDTGKKEIYVDQCLYRKGMLNADIAQAMDDEGVPKGSIPIYADCAEPKTIEELYGYGWNMLPSYKATRKAEQLQTLRGYRLFVTKRSVETIREMRGYVWAKDKDGNSLNEPIAFNDHAMDALRYGTFLPISEAATAVMSFGFGDDYIY